MAWSDVAVWAGVVIAGGAAIASGVQAKAARDEARAARDQAQSAKVSEAAAEEASKRAESVAGSMQQIAGSVGEMAQSLRQSKPAINPPKFRTTTTHSVAFAVEYVSSVAYRLRNVGTREATNVVILPDGLPEFMRESVARKIPRLAVGQSQTLTMILSWGEIMPGELWVTCDQLEQAVVVPIPN